MATKGYCSKSQLVTEPGPRQGRGMNSARPRANSKSSSEFQVPKEVLTLRGLIETAENNYTIGGRRGFEAQEDRLAHIRKQIENCRVARPSRRHRRSRQKELEVEAARTGSSRLPDQEPLQVTRSCADGGRGLGPRDDRSPGSGRDAGQHSHRIDCRSSDLPAKLCRSFPFRSRTRRSGTRTCDITSRESGWRRHRAASCR